MARKTATQLERAKLAKSVRQIIRLKYSLAADDEINEKLPDLLDEFDYAIANGKGFQFALEQIITGVRNDEV